MSEWIILELGQMAEDEDPALISASIRYLIRDAEVFIPASVTQVGEDRVVTYLVDGYAFIKRAHPDERYLRLEDTRYIQAVVRAPGTKRKVLAVLKDRDIDKFRRQIRAHSDQGIGVGDTVSITSGPYKNLQAEVVEDIPEHDSVQVRIELRSKDSLVSLPRSFLSLVTKVSLPPYVKKTVEHREWLDSVLPILRWESFGFEPLRAVYGEYRKLTHWLSYGRGVQAELRLSSSDTRLDSLRKLSGQNTKITRWLQAGNRLQSFLKSFDRDFDATALQGLHDKLVYIQMWLDRFDSLSAFLQSAAGPTSFDIFAETWRQYELLDAASLKFLDISRSVRALEHEMAGDTMIQNLIIDGMNMAVRCSMAPGLSDLKDSKGQPTGAIVGFLNSLVALRKKHPEAEIWVCWDSPSTHRKDLYPAYKANRNPLRATFEVDWLKRFLPLLGVWQVSSEGQEADDVIASLVRGRLDGQRNLIVSNDRDFMQLVSMTTNVLVPAVGPGKEKVCTPDVVEADYGVTPAQMLHLRALGGDASDNIPGAPGCGNKTASKLLRLYGTVDGIFQSNLAGLSPVLCEKLRGAEKQVRLNLLLMALGTGLDLVLSPPNIDPLAAGNGLDDIRMNPTRVFTAFFGRRFEEAT
jgi:5'-3' exonuclease/transcription antitermination factor NusG